MITKRLLETMAMTIIGDSMLCILKPQRHTALWLSGPTWWRRAWEPFVRHPHLTRALGAVGVGFGVWLASREEPTRGEVHEELESAPQRWAGRLAEVMK